MRPKLTLTALLGVAAALALFAPAAASAKTVTYPGCGATLTVCIDHHPGATIDVKRGTFYENVVVDKRVTVVGKCGKTVFDATSKSGATSDGFTIDAAKVTLRCLEIRHATGYDGVTINGPFAGVKLDRLNVLDALNGVEAQAGSNGLAVTNSSFQTESNAAILVDPGATTGVTIGKDHVSNSGFLCLDLNVSRSTISANRLADCNNGGLLAKGDHNTVTGNLARFIGGIDFEVDGTKNTISSNRGMGTPDTVFSMYPGTGDIVKNNSTDGEVIGFDYDLAGNGATITGNVADNTVSGGFNLVGNNLRVRNNRTQGNIYGDAFDVTGNNAVISGNRVTTGADSSAVDVEGHKPIVTDNRATGGFDAAGFLVNCTGNCSGAIVSGNSEEGAENKACCGTTADGYDIFSTGCTTPGCMTIEHNRAAHNLQDGFFLSTAFALVQDNTATTSGQGAPGCNAGSSGFELASGTGNGTNVLEGNTASRNPCDGFYVNSPGNTLKRNTAQDNVVMGFQVETSGNRLFRNTALSNYGDGINNDGTSTVVTSNTSSGNLRNCTNDDRPPSSEGATIATNTGNACGRHAFTWASTLTDW